MKRQYLDAALAFTSTEDLKTVAMQLYCILRDLDAPLVESVPTFLSSESDVTMMSMSATLDGAEAVDEFSLL